MSPDLAANGIVGRFPGAATPTKSPVDVEASMSPPRKRPSDVEFDRPTEIIQTRPSQAAVDRVYQVKWIAVIAATISSVLIPLIAAVFLAVPWYGQNILKPESQGRIEDSHALTKALETFAEASKISASATAENDETLRQIREQIKLFSAVTIELRNEVRELRKGLQ